MKRSTLNIIGVIAGIILATVVFWVVTTIPEAQNTLRSVLPEQNIANSPPEQISAPKQRDEAGSMVRHLIRHTLLPKLTALYRGYMEHTSIYLLNTKWIIIL